MIGRNLMYPLYQGRDFAGWARVDKIGGFLHPERRPAWLLQPLEIDLDDSTWRPYVRDAIAAEENAAYEAAEDTRERARGRRHHGRHRDDARTPPRSWCTCTSR